MREEEMDALLIERHGQRVFEKLKQSHVAIAGLGGLGSNVAVMLARAGIGSLHLVDFDQVEGSNLNRQFYKIKHLGRDKTTALKEEIAEINPYIRVQTDQVRVTAQNATAIFRDASIVCEAFDRPENKAMLINTLLEQRPDIRIVAGSGMAGYESSNQIKTKKRMRNLWVCGDDVNGIEEKGTLMAPRVTLCAAHQANLIVRLILGEEGIEDE